MRQHKRSLPNCLQEQMNPMIDSGQLQDVELKITAALMPSSRSMLSRDTRLGISTDSMVGPQGQKISELFGVENSIQNTTHYLF